MYAQCSVMEEELGYEVDTRTVAIVLSDRRGTVLSRQLSSHERRSQQARYSRRTAPTRTSGSHRRHNKHHGL